MANRNLLHPMLLNIWALIHHSSFVITGTRMAQNPITAIVFREGNVEWTTLRPVKSGYDVGEYRTAKVAPVGTVLDFAAAETPAAIRRICGHIRSDLCAGLPSDKTLMRVVDLPTSDPAEMKGMVDLQVDKFSPFPVEHMTVALEVLSQKEKTSRVLIVALQREIVETFGRALGQAGLLPRWIDVQVMGWWSMLKERGEIPEKGRKVILLLEKTGTELIACQDGMPVVFRSLGSGQGLSEEDFFSELADETAYTLTTLEAERGAVDGVKMDLWHGAFKAPPKVVVPDVTLSAVPPPANGPPPTLVEKLRLACGVEVDCRSLDTLPPLTEGLARRTAAKGDTALNLAPPEWRTQEHGRRTKKSLLFASVVFLVVWLAGVAAFLGGLKLQENRLDQWKSSVAVREKSAARVKELKDKITSFEQYADRSRSALECLREISALLPQGVEITSFSYKKGASLSLRGECATPEPIYSFVQALQQSPLFTEVKTEGVRSKMGQRGVQTSEFSLTASLPGGEKK
jgi:Tfp pilus assembly protein PilN